jgi:hypothetical protein
MDSSDPVLEERVRSGPTISVNDGSDTYGRVVVAVAD